MGKDPDPETELTRTHIKVEAGKTKTNIHRLDTKGGRGNRI